MSKIIESKPNCYKCKNRGSIAGSAHSCCIKIRAKVKGHEHGIKRGWFMWPFNFDPSWLLECDGFEEKGEVVSE
ncbi:hypothetical protein DW1_1110 [Proteiniborus sp. DW1]|uniref:hypothetical protein n=1 Tax=Proteiniborus sp. DW1 TaxID=1889883 RepID=UPI00092E04DC|nr:hypothetical protein [Proteiniborus sp. DW1]SCG82683.1 hypothetical protein DW1_1110 [Proteiniborus sp. DW1]